MECILCIKQYVGMAEISFNVSKTGIISTNEESLPLSISYQILPNERKSHPLAYGKRKLLDSIIICAIPKRFQHGPY